MILKAFTIIVILVLSIKAAIAIKWPFWSKQPVFHYWNAMLWMTPNRIINPMPFNKTSRYYDRNIAFEDIGDSTPETIAEFCELVRTHFMRSKEVDFSPLPTNILAHFKYNDRPSNIAYLKSQSQQQMIGAITGRPLTCYLSETTPSNKGKVSSTRIPMNYVDFLCVDTKHRKKDVAPKLIYTYYANQQSSNQVCLFKREGDTHFIVPLCAYMTHGFSLEKLFYNLRIRKKTFVLPPLTTILHINDTKSLSILTQYEHTLKSVFKCLILPVMTNIAHLIETNVYHMYALISEQDSSLLSLYVFKDMETTFDGEKSLDCIASFNNTDKTTFVNGFLNVLATKISTNVLVIENIAHNAAIISAISAVCPPSFHSKTSYYFYNYAAHPLESRDAFILC
jgi:hypothetical protein